MNAAAAGRKEFHTAERIASEIRKAIRRGGLLPGEHVVQNEWAARLDVSSAPTREALKMLVAEHLLSYEVHRGYFVTRIDPYEMSQIYRLRQLLETEVLQSIRWPDPEELRSLRKAMSLIIECVQRGDGHGALDAVRTVSFTIFDLSPLNVVVAETKRLWDRAAVYRALSLVEDPDGRQTQQFYDDFFQMLKARDREGLIELNFKRRADIPLKFL